VTTLVVLVSGATAIRALEEWRAVMEEYERLGFFVARAVAALVVHEGGVTDSGRLQDLIAGFGQHPGVADVLVVDTSFRIVADAHPAEVGLTYRGPDVVAAITEGREATEIKRYAGRPVLDVVVPIREDHRVTGALEVALELAPAQARLAAFLRRGVWLTLLVAAVTAAVLIVILSAVVVEPIADLARRAGRLRTGDFSVEFPDGRADEIGHLGRILEAARDALKELSAVWVDQQPLTGLPGNQAIQRELRRRLEAGTAFVVLYADVDRFKAYNDRYGFARGDMLISHVAESLRQAVRACGQPEDFLGHVGGDDFVLAVAPERAEAIATEAIRRFEAGLVNHVDPADFERGSLEADDARQGRGRVPCLAFGRCDCGQHR